MTHLGVVIVSYRSDHVLPDLLASLDCWEPTSAVVVVDNHSPEGPPDVDRRIRLVSNPGNLGFGTACNVGYRALAADGVEYVAFVNPDVRLVGPSLSELSEAMDAEPNTGIATTQLLDKDGAPSPSAWGPPSISRALWSGTGWQLRRSRRWIGRMVHRGASLSGASMTGRALDVDGFVVGGAMMVRPACFEQLGGFDERFFMFGEDADLCHRARCLDWNVKVLPATPMIHLGGSSSSGVTDPQRWEWYLESHRRFYERHVGGFKAEALMCALRIGALLGRRRA